MTRRWSSRISAGNSSTTPLPGSGAPPTFRSASTATALGASELTLAKPAGVLDGDVLTALIAQHGTSIPTAPLGWNFIRRDTTISPTYQQSLYWRRVSPDFPVSPAFRAANSGAAAQATSVTIAKPAGVVQDDVMVAQIAQGKDAAPTFVAASTVAICAGNNTIVAKPAGTVQNDVMIAQISFTNDGDVNLPAGWNLIRDDRSGTPPQNIGPRQKLLWKRAGASEPTSYNFTAIGLSGRAITLVTYRGVILIGDPVDAHGGQLGTTAAVAPSITTIGFHRMLVACFSSNQDMIIEGPKWTPPAGMTERSDNGINCNLADISSEFADQVVQQGATGTRTATQVGVSTRTVGALVALKPEPQALQTVTPPAGWTLIRTDDTDYRQALYWLRAGASEPSSYIWTFGGTVDAVAAICAYAGIVTVGNPVDAHAATVTTDSSIQDVVAPSVTTTTTSTMLLGLFSGRPTGTMAATWSPPSQMTERVDASDGTSFMPQSIEIADQFISTAGATGTRTARASLAVDDSIGALVALKATAPVTAEPVNYTWTNLGGVDVAGSLLAYFGITAIGDPVNDSRGEETVAGTNQIVASPVTNATAGSRLIGFYGKKATIRRSYEYTAPAGTTERTEVQTSNFNLSHVTSDELFSAGGNSGQRLATYDPDDASPPSLGQLVTLTPAVAGGGPVFEGTAEAVEDFSAVRVFVLSDVPSAANGLEILWSSDGTTFAALDRFTIDPPERSEILPIKARFVRIRYTNGGLAQSFFNLETTLVPETDQATPRKEFRRIHNATAGIGPGTVTTLLTLSGDQAARAVEVEGYGVGFNAAPDPGVPTAAIDYYMEIRLDNVVKHSQIVRGDRKAFISLTFATEGKTVTIHVRHDLAGTNVSFRATLQVRELI